MTLANACRLNQPGPHHQRSRRLQPVTDASAGPPDGMSGCQRLAAGKALTLHARHAGLLRIAHGRIWLTAGHGWNDLPVRAGDHILGRGESLFLAAGETVVMETFGLGHAPPAHFSWETAPAGRSKGAARAGGPGLAGLVGSAVTRAAAAFAVCLAAFHTRKISSERSFKNQTCK